MENLKNQDSVFDKCTEDELEFDTMFDTEDSLIDTVNGVNEAGEPLTGDEYATLHHVEDDATPKDMKDELGEGHDTGDAGDCPEGSEKQEVLDTSVKGEVDKPSDADKTYANTEEEYHNNDDKGADPNPENIESEMDSAVSEGCSKKKACKEDTVEEGCSKKKVCKEEDDIDTILNSDDDEDEIVDEAAKSDVEAVANAEDIDAILNDTEKDVKAPKDLSYDPSDEQLLDLVMNNKL